MPDEISPSFLKGEHMSMKSMGPRIVGTILVGVFWFAFTVLYLAFFASNFNLWQKAAIFLATGAIAAGLILVFWVKWALSPLAKNE